MSQEFKQVDRNIMSEATFNAQKSNLPLGAVVDITDAISVNDCDQNIQKSISNAKRYLHQVATVGYGVISVILSTNTALTTENIKTELKKTYGNSAFLIPVGHDANFFSGVCFIKHDGTSLYLARIDNGYADVSFSSITQDTITEL